MTGKKGGTRRNGGKDGNERKHKSRRISMRVVGLFKGHSGWAQIGQDHNRLGLQDVSAKTRMVARYTGYACLVGMLWLSLAHDVRGTVTTKVGSLKVGQEGLQGSQKVGLTEKDSCYNRSVDREAQKRIARFDAGLVCLALGGRNELQSPDLVLSSLGKREAARWVAMPATVRSRRKRRLRTALQNELPEPYEV